MMTYWCLWLIYLLSVLEWVCSICSAVVSIIKCRLWVPGQAFNFACIPYSQTIWRYTSPEGKAVVKENLCLVHTIYNYLLVCSPYTDCTQDQISVWEAGESRRAFCHSLNSIMCVLSLAANEVKNSFSLPVQIWTALGITRAVFSLVMAVTCATQVSTTDSGVMLLTCLHCLVTAVSQRKMLT